MAGVKLVLWTQISLLNEMMLSCKCFLQSVKCQHSHRGPSWPWSYSSWIYNYLCNQCQSLLKLWVRTPFMTKCPRKNIMWSSLLVTCDRSWFSLGTPVSSTNKTDRRDMTEILLKVALNTINQQTINKHI